LESGSIIIVPPFWLESNSWKRDTIKEIVKKGLSKNVTISIITACESTNSSKMKDIEPYIYTFNSKPFDLKKLVDDFKKLN
jgi:hypothetical protein